MVNEKRGAFLPEMLEEVFGNLRPRTLYLSGPMTGKPGHNFDTFNEVAEMLRWQGYRVLNPAENYNGRTDLPRATYMRRDISLLLQAHEIVMLEGWRASKGASLEYEIAMELGLPAKYARPLNPGYDIGPVPDRAIDVAKELVNGARRGDYGHPLDDYDRTAKMWSAILGKEVTAEQAIMCMVAVKISRECNRPKDDNRIDMAGYAECLDMTVKERELRSRSPSNGKPR